MRFGINRAKTMNYYHAELLRIKNMHFPKEAVIRQIVRAKHFADKHFEKKINLGDLSGSSHLSRYHFIRLFRKCYGRTPHQYLTEVRIEKAKQLLLRGESVSGTCYFVGFESPASFSTLFKKFTGLAPSEFLKKSNFQKAP